MWYMQIITRGILKNNGHFPHHVMNVRKKPRESVVHEDFTTAKGEHEVSMLYLLLINIKK